MSVLLRDWCIGCEISYR